VIVPLPKHVLVSSTSDNQNNGRLPIAKGVIYIFKILLVLRPGGWTVEGLELDSELLLDKSSHLRCWRLRSADQLPTGLVLSEASGPHLQEQTVSRFKLHKALYNNKRYASASNSALVINVVHN
jgi:hypothetical protein